MQDQAETSHPVDVGSCREPIARLTPGSGLELLEVNVSGAALGESLRDRVLAACR
jgi:hypothetical protein